MRVLAMADLHLGFRQYERSTRDGINQREADINGTFTRVVDQAIAIRPDVILIAGDVFHFVRPGTHSLIHAVGEMQRLTRALPGTEIVMIGGNHDLPKAKETGCVLPLFRTFGVHVVLTSQRITLPGLSILCVPDGVGIARPAFEPDASAKYNVLLMHGAVAGMPKHGSEEPISHAALNLDAFDYVALGHYHVCHQVAENGGYSGSMDYTSSDPWGELRTGQPKGMVLVDIDAGTREFIPIAPSRPLIDLPIIEALGLSTAEVNAAILANAESVEMRGAIVRQVIRDLDRVASRALDRTALKRITRPAFNYKFDERRPEIVRVRGTSAATSRRREPLDALVARHFASVNLAPDVDRAAFTALGLDYLAQAEQLERARERPETISADDHTEAAA